MSEKHTPGPWTAINVGSHWDNPNVENWIVTFNAAGEQIVDHVYEAADAHLIAAAPDLLITLEGLLDAYSRPDQRICCSGIDCGCMGATTYQQAEHYAREAIAKARGAS